MEKKKKKKMRWVPLYNPLFIISVLCMLYIPFFHSTYYIHVGTIQNYKYTSEKSENSIIRKQIESSIIFIFFMKHSVKTAKKQK